MCHAIVLDTTGTVYAFYEKKTKETKKKSKEKIAKKKRTRRAPPQGMWLIKQNELTRNDSARQTRYD